MVELYVPIEIEDLVKKSLVIIPALWYESERA